MSTYTPIADLSPEARRLLADIARGQLAKLLSAALDAADVLTQVNQNYEEEERAELDEMIRTSIQATINLLP